MMNEFNVAVCEAHTEDLKEIKEDVKKINGTLRGTNGDIGLCGQVNMNKTYIETQLRKQDRFQWTLIAQSIIVIGALLVAVLKWFIL